MPHRAASPDFKTAIQGNDQRVGPALGKLQIRLAGVVLDTLRASMIVAKGTAAPVMPVETDPVIANPGAPLVLFRCTAPFRSKITTWAWPWMEGEAMHPADYLTRPNPSTLADKCIRGVQHALRGSPYIWTEEKHLVIASGVQPMPAPELRRELAESPFLSDEAPIPQSGPGYAHLLAASAQAVFSCVTGAEDFPAILCEVSSEGRA